MPIARRATRPIPRTGSPRSSYEMNDYSLGMNDFLSNDKFPLKDRDSNWWRLAQDARIPTFGEYGNRKGFDFHSAAVGETIDVQQTSTTGAADQDFSETARFAKKITFTTTGRCNRLDINLKNSAAATGTVIIELWSNVSGAPGVLLARSSIAASDIDTSYGYEVARLVEAPAVTATDYWVVGYVQATSSGSYKVSSTTNASTGLTSTDSGATWAASSEDYNVKAYLATDSISKGLHRAYKSDGTAVTLLAHGTTLSSVNEVTGALTSIKTGLNSSATHYRFVTINDIVYYINGFDGLRKWNFTTESQVSATNYTHLTDHKGLLFLVTKDDPNKMIWSNFGDYETFTSTDLQYIPSPKTGDPITAILPLNGYLLIWTRNNKYILSGDDNATFRLDEAPDQKGTFTQETVAWDKNFAYYLSDDGVYRTNGSEAQLLSENIYKTILELPNKDEACMVVNKGRLYLWYTTDGASANSNCYVWNLNFSSKSDTVESHDNNAYVTRAITAYNDDNALLVASSLIGQVYWQELDSNDNTNLGGDIEFELDTHYMMFESPAVLKEIRHWVPRFKAQSGNYTIDVEYAYDLRDNWQTYSSPSVLGSGYLWGDADTVWGAFTWGTSAETQANLYVPGEYRRIALRYKHYATRQPQVFLGHSLVVESRRIR